MLLNSAEAPRVCITLQTAMIGVRKSMTRLQVTRKTATGRLTPQTPLAVRGREGRARRAAAWTAPRGERRAQRARTYGASTAARRRDSVRSALISDSYATSCDSEPSTMLTERATSTLTRSTSSASSAASSSAIAASAACASPDTFLHPRRARAAVSEHRDAPGKLLMLRGLHCRTHLRCPNGVRGCFSDSKSEPGM